MPWFGNISGCRGCLSRYEDFGWNVGLGFAIFREFPVLDSNVLSCPGDEPRIAMQLPLKKLKPWLKPCWTLRVRYWNF